MIHFYHSLLCNSFVSVLSFNIYDISKFKREKGKGKNIIRKYLKKEDNMTKYQSIVVKAST